MTHYQNQYSATTQDTDEFGNPIEHGTTGATGFGTATTGTGYGATYYPNTGGQQQQVRGTTTMDKIKDNIPGTGGGRRADDPYSSHAHTGTGTAGTGYGTTETPYTGGEHHERGLMDKISGTGHKDEAYSSHTTSTTAPYGGTTVKHHGKKSIMDKIKEKLAGGHY